MTFIRHRINIILLCGKSEPPEESPFQAFAVSMHNPASEDRGEATGEASGEEAVVVTTDHPTTEPKATVVRGLIKYKPDFLYSSTTRLDKNAPPYVDERRTTRDTVPPPEFRC